MKILQVAFLLLFNYLDSLPKLYKFISFVREGTIVHPASYNNLRPIPSGPVAFVVSRDLIKSRTSCSEAIIESNLITSCPF